MSRRPPAVEAIEQSLIEQVDPLDIDPTSQDPQMHYRWTSPRKIRQRRAQGYEIVSRSESGVRLLYEGEEQQKGADDTFTVNGMVLMACPLELWQRRERARNNLTRARLGTAEQGFINKARRKGVRITKQDQDEEKLR